jgi:hypothetical protein
LRNHFLLVFLLGWGLAGCHLKTHAKRHSKGGDKKIEFVEYLPQDTLLYARVDLAEIVKQTRKGLALIDSQIAFQIDEQVKSMWDKTLVQMAEEGMKPLLADKILSTPVHFVLLDQSRPGSTAFSNEPKKGQTKDLFTALVLECGSQVAMDFFVHLKTMFLRREVEWISVDLGAGEVISLNKDFHIARLNDFLVLSDVAPHRLFSLLQSPPPETLADTERYGYFSQGHPAAFFFLNLARFAQDAMMEKNSKDLASLVFFRRLFGLDKFRAVGARLDYTGAQDEQKMRISLSFLHDEPLPKLLSLLLDSGPAFDLPAAPEEQGFALMFRLDPGAVYKEISLHLPERKRHEILLFSSEVNQRLGYSVDDLLALLAGDWYFLCQANDKDGASVFSSAQMRDSLLMLLGIHDHEATKKALEKLAEVVAQMSRIPGVRVFLKRQEFQGVTMYLVGPSGEGRSPVFVVALMKKHIAMGGFGPVTDLIRRSTAGRQQVGRLNSLVEKQPDANVLAFLSRGWVAFLEKEIHGERLSKELVEEFRSQKFFPGNVMENEWAEAAINVLELSRALSEKKAMKPGEPAVVVYGRHDGRHYRLVFESEMRKRP